MEIKRILAATDYSACSLPALGHALDLGRRFGSRIDVLHVWELPIGILPDWIIQAPGEPDQPATQLVRNRAGSELERMVSGLRLTYENVHGRLETGDPAQQIVTIAGREHYDLIVMGTHGRTGLSHLWTGSVAERVVRTAACPVLTVRGSDASKAPK
jgi:nucleotide-binding universal stress UspA family protein